jgi:ATP-binding cassette, subfamily B, bacterial
MGQAASGDAQAVNHDLGTESNPDPTGASVTRFLRRVLLVYLRPYWAHYIPIVLFMALALVFDTLLPLGIKFLIDYAITPHDSHMLTLVLGGLAVLFVLSSLGNILHDYLCIQVALRLLSDLRSKMFTHLQGLPASFYSRAQAGDLTSRFTNDLSAIEGAVADSLINGLFAILRLAACVGVLFVLNWPMTLAMALLLPLTMIAPSALVRRATDASYQRKLDEAAIASTAQEYIGAHAVTRN